MEQSMAAYGLMQWMPERTKTPSTPEVDELPYVQRKQSESDSAETPTEEKTS